MSKSLFLPADILAAPASASASPEQNPSWQERRDWLRTWLKDRPLVGIPEEEIEAHFSAMPARYWEHVSEADLLWGLGAVHEFLKTIASPRAAATTPFVDWRHESRSGWTRVIFCTWDRHGLLAKVAAAFSGVRLNIHQADVFTRMDNVVLDIFRVEEPDGRTPASSARLRDMTFLLDGALSEPPRFASVWACSRHKFLAPRSRIPPQITFDNDSLPDATLLRVQAADRLGLLYDLLQAVADSGLNIIQAQIDTQDRLANDVLHVTDAHNQKLLDPTRLAEFRRNLETALMVAS